MEIEFNIAIRYFFSKKRINIVNIIVFLSILSLSISTFSMSTILFVFSGLENFNKKFYKIHYPDIIMSLFNEQNLFMDNDNILKKEIKSVKGIAAISETMEKKIFLYYKNHNFFIPLKGVDKEYEKVMKNFKKIDLVNTSYPDYLNIYVGSNSIMNYLPIIYYMNIPNRIFFFSYKRKKNSFVPFFIKKKILVKGIFTFSSNMDIQYLFCNLYNLQDIIKEKGVHTLEIKIHDKADVKKIKKNLLDKFGSKFKIITRTEKEKAFYKIFKTEKIFLYFLFGLMIFITSFNLFSAIYILQLDKLNELMIFWNMGFSLYRIKTIFFYIGCIITIIGCSSGLLIAYIISYMQEMYHFFKIGSKIPFPVKITMVDSWIVVSIIFIVGIIISFFSSRRIELIT
ncbi:ABC transporter permease [Blattabacterium cuenoti]|uniref:ABC transporter permease n=1 Tax=Blattabacterium cuenoti TaxID=1653831 RepID=UPI00163BD926|nr:ABC transporter permease [Blattabacterium cuenoti]